MKAEIIAIGSELISGQSLDTNSQWISKSLGDLGIPVRFHTTIGDDFDENVAAFRVAIERADLIIVSGGLGPTQDDLTRDVVAAVAGVSLKEDPDSLEAIRALFSRRSREMPERNKVQALLPEGAEALFNRVGTAPGVWRKVGRATIACLPGVPNEMKTMFGEQVVPRFKSGGFVDRVIVHHKINLFGKGESEVEMMAMDLTVRGRVPEVGITASDATIAFRVAGEGPTEDVARAMMQETIDTIRERFAEFIVGEGTVDVLESAVNQMHRTGTTLATAESCTGGLIARQLTTVPGVSSVYHGGLVTYTPDAKIELLGLSRELLEEYGVVSEQVAAAMATLVKAKFRSDAGIGVTGIAGPGGGTPETPVGTVYIGLAVGEVVIVKKLEVGPEQPREVIQSRATKHALNMLRLALRNA